MMASEKSCGPDKGSLDAQWEEWKKTFKKQYKDEEEEKYRRKIWEQNLKMIEAHNQEEEEGLHTYTVGMNHFGDLAPDEMPC